jgi:hypothetical protein
VPKPALGRDGKAVQRPKWLALIHRLPPTPAYLRVKIRRRLHRLGAYAVKQTVYVLPNTDEALEDLQWLRQEIESDGGTAVIAELSFLEGIGDEEIEANGARRSGMAAEDERVPVIDKVTPGRTWVTRVDVFVDRIASAWLIRRFIDPKARFKFVPPRGYKPRSGELRYDMSNAEYTHVGQACTFQTLTRRFGLSDPALRVIGEIVHDIDCKDDAFKRPEAAGVESLLRGVTRRSTDDRDRLERGGVIFDDLYASYSRK